MRDEKPKDLTGLPSTSWGRKNLPLDPAEYERIFAETCKRLDEYMEKKLNLKKKVSK